MPRYFFHIADGREILDREGTELADDAEARAQAVMLAGGMLRDIGCDFWNSGHWRLRVVNEAGRTVCALRLAADPPPG
jgi:hypothetical protein